MVQNLVNKYKSKFNKIISNDLEVNNSIGLLFEFISEVKKRDLKKEDKSLIVDFLKDVDLVLGIDLFREDEVPQEILKLAKKREAKRYEKRFEEADSIREELRLKGYEILDRKNREEGFIVRKI